MGVSRAILRQKKPECWGTRANEGQLKKWGEGGWQEAQGLRQGGLRGGVRRRTFWKSGAELRTQS